MLNLQKFASDRLDLGYDFSSSNIASASTTIFVPPANNIKVKNNDVKIELASENLDKGKSILGAPSKLEKKSFDKTLELRRLTLKSLNKRSSISIIIVVLPVILDITAISGYTLNRGTT